VVEREHILNQAEGAGLPLTFQAVRLAATCESGFESQKNQDEDLLQFDQAMALHFRRAMEKEIEHVKG
jgi:hypothetical protein